MFVYITEEETNLHQICKSYELDHYRCTQTSAFRLVSPQAESWLGRLIHACCLDFNTSNKMKEVTYITVTS